MILVLSLLLAMANHASAAPKTIYNEDNRVAYADSTNPKHKLWARSTAAMINQWIITDGPTEEVKHVDGWTLEHYMNICPDERFAKYTSNAFCSGFLVAPDILVTAGHCISSQFMCDDHRWVFDYRQDLMPYGDDKALIQTKNIYKCKEIITTALNSDTEADYAVIRLDRPVTDREPLKYRTEGKVPDSAKLVAIGHPSGIGTVITPNGFVRSNNHPQYFITTLDTFGGNSGSAVINEKTGRVEGILVRGDEDYHLDPAAGCMRPSHCKFNECTGEHVSRITRTGLE